MQSQKPTWSRSVGPRNSEAAARKLDCHHASNYWIQLTCVRGIAALTRDFGPRGKALPPYELYTQLFTESSCIEFRCTCDSKCEYTCSSIIPSSRSVGVLTSAVENFKRSFRRLPLVTLELAPPPERLLQPDGGVVDMGCIGPSWNGRSVRLSREDPQKKNKRVPSFVNMLLTRWPKQGLMKIVESSCAVIARGYFKRNILNQVCGFMWGATVQNLWEVDTFYQPISQSSKIASWHYKRRKNGPRIGCITSPSVHGGPLQPSAHRQASIHLEEPHPQHHPTATNHPPITHLDLVLCCDL